MSGIVFATICKVGSKFPDTKRDITSKQVSRIVPMLLDQLKNETVSPVDILESLRQILLVSLTAMRPFVAKLENSCLILLDHSDGMKKRKKK